MLSLKKLRHLKIGLTAIVLWTFTSAAAIPAPAVPQSGSSAGLGNFQSASSSGATSAQFSEAIDSFYSARAHRPVWVSQGRLNQDGLRLIQVVLSANDQGIDLPGLNVFAASGVVGPLSGEGILVYDRRLTEAFLKYAQAVSAGRIAPNDIGMIWAIERPTFDPWKVLYRLQHENALDLLNDQPPHHVGYWQLVAALATYRYIEASGGWSTIPDGPVLELGQSNDRVFLLRYRLTREGYIPEGSAQSRLFDEALQWAVRSFQESHGLAVDGRVGDATLSALNESVAARVAQIKVNLERWRWMPRHLPPRRIEVNVAAAELTVFDNDTPVLAMRTIVGAPRHRTPMLHTAVQAVIINPPWNVPISIAVNEILPRLRRDPDYLRRQDMHIVNRSDDPYGLQIDWRNLPRQSYFRFQQQPGALNALGRLKFDMPNRFDVYLHDTPARTLFAGVKRALSHGCIRLQEPEKLANYLLGQSGDRLSAALLEADTVRIPLRNPIPVYLLYWTAYTAADGGMQFRDDVYGYDGAMIALQRQATPSQFMSQLDVGGCPPG